MKHQNRHAARPGAWPVSAAAVLAVASTLVLPLAAKADTTVGCGNVAVLKAGITAANTTPGNDVITLAQGCTYQLTSNEAGTDNALPVVTGAGTITIEGRNAR